MSKLLSPPKKKEKKKKGKGQQHGTWHGLASEAIDSP
jgi:hypothetical protein